MPGRRGVLGLRVQREQHRAELGRMPGPFRAYARQIDDGAADQRQKIGREQPQRALGVERPQRLPRSRPARFAQTLRLQKLRRDQIGAEDEEQIDAISAEFEEHERPDGVGFVDRMREKNRQYGEGAKAVELADIALRSLHRAPESRPAGLRCGVSTRLRRARKKERAREAQRNRAFRLRRVDRRARRH